MLSFAGQTYNTKNVVGKVKPRYNECFNFYIPDIEVEEANEIKVGVYYQDLRHNSTYGKYTRIFYLTYLVFFICLESNPEYAAGWGLLDLSELLRYASPGKEKWHQGWISVASDHQLSVADLEMKQPLEVPAVHMQLQWNPDEGNAENYERHNSPVKNTTQKSDSFSEGSQKGETASNANEAPTPKMSTSPQEGTETSQALKPRLDFDSLVEEIHNIAGGVENSGNHTNSRRHNNGNLHPQHEPKYRGPQWTDQAVKQETLNEYSSYTSDFEDTIHSEKGRESRRKSRTSRSRAAKINEEYWRTLATPHRKRTASPTRRQKLLMKLKESKKCNHHDTRKSLNSSIDKFPQRRTWNSDVKIQREEETLDIGITGHPVDVKIAHKLEKPVPSTLQRTSSPYRASMPSSTKLHPLQRRATTTHRRRRTRSGKRNRRRSAARSLSRSATSEGKKRSDVAKTSDTAPPDSASFLTGDSRVQPPRVRKEPKEVHTLPKEYAKLDPGIRSDRVSVVVPRDVQDEERKSMHVVKVPVEPRSNEKEGTGSLDGASATPSRESFLPPIEGSNSPNHKTISASADKELRRTNSNPENTTSSDSVDHSKEVTRPSTTIGTRSS